MSRRTWVAVGIGVATGGIGLGIAYSLGLFNSKKRTTATKLNDYVPSTLTLQGAYVPLLLGTRRLGPVHAWAGDRLVVKTSGSSGGRKGARRQKSQATEETIYYESGWHLLCVGPATKITKIWQGGQVIFDGEINSTDDPSGSTIILDTGDEFAIYWGDNQPVNAFLGDADRVGVPSRWPFLCYIQWTRKNIGTNAQWQQMEYEVTVDTQNTTAAETWAGISNGLAYNPAAQFTQLLTTPWPYGAGLDLEPIAAEFDTGASGTFKDFGLEADAAEFFSSVLAADGTEAKEAVGAFMQDHGLMLSWDVEADHWKLMRIRKPEAGETETIPSDTAIGKVPTIERLHGEAPADRLVFSFADKDRQYRDSTIAIRADGQAIYLQSSKARNMPLATVTRFSDAAFLASRRSQEEMGGQARYTIQCGRAARRLRPGNTIVSPHFEDVNGYSPVLRVVGVSIETNTMLVTVEAVQDSYGVEVFTPPALEAGDAGGTGGTGSVGGENPPVEDEAFNFIEVPEVLLGGLAPSIIVPRLRAAGNIVGADLHLSLDDTTYELADRETAVVSGGALLDLLPADDPFFIETGPTFEALGPDIAEVEDLTSDPGAWKRGRQVAVIENEIFFVRNVVALGGTTYRLDGLLRARYDTVRAAHAITAKVFIFRFDEMVDVASPMLLPSNLLYVKAQPLTSGGAVSLGSITPISKTLVGKGIAPLRPCSLRTTAPFAGVKAFETGDDVSIQWDYLTATGFGSFDMTDHDAAYPLAAAPNDFEIEFLTTGDVLKRTVQQTGTTYTYVNATMVADFAGEPSAFKVRVRAVNGGLRSDYVERTIERV